MRSGSAQRANSIPLSRMRCPIGLRPSGNLSSSTSYELTPEVKSYRPSLPAPRYQPASTWKTSTPIAFATSTS